MSTMCMPGFSVVSVETDPSVQPATWNVRETPEIQVEQRRAEILMRRERMRLLNELSLYQQQTDALEQVPSTKAVAAKRSSWFGVKLAEMLDIIGVFGCRYLHSKITYFKGDQHYTCVICKRKYGVIFLNSDQIYEPNVYVMQSGATPSDPRIMPRPQYTKTLQALCKHGTQAPC